MGNNREIWNAMTGQTVQRTDYFASGLPIFSANTLEAESDLQKLNKRKFGDKEFIEDFGYDSYDYGFRGYYPAIARFTSIDPLAERFYSQSPYRYCNNN